MGIFTRVLTKLSPKPTGYRAVDVSTVFSSRIFQETTNRYFVLGAMAACWSRETHPNLSFELPQNSEVMNEQSEEFVKGWMCTRSHPALWDSTGLQLKPSPSSPFTVDLAETPKNGHTMKLSDESTAIFTTHNKVGSIKFLLINLSESHQVLFSIGQTLKYKVQDTLPTHRPYSITQSSPSQRPTLYPYASPFSGTASLWDKQQYETYRNRSDS